MTYAWSRGLKPPSFVHLYQYKNGQRIGGADCDFTRALLPDFGQWGYQEDEMTPADFVALLKDPDVKAALTAAVGNTDNVITAPAAGGSADTNKYWAIGTFLQNIYTATVAARGYAATAAAKDGVSPDDVKAIIAGVIAGLPAADIAAAIDHALSADEAKAVADELAQRLSA
jgi:hypothetical protein